MLGIKHIVLAVNKMDLVDYDPDVFEQITADFMALNQRLQFTQIQPIPISALNGDNILGASEKTPWFRGPSLLQYLEEVEVGTDQNAAFRYPVQFVVRPNQDFRGYAGQIASGAVTTGDRVKILPSAQESRVTDIFNGEERLDHAVAGQSITIQLDGEYDVSRGDMIVAADRPAMIADQFRVNIVWMDQAQMLPGRAYLFKSEGQSATAMLAKPRYRVNMSTYAEEPTDTLGLNDIASCNLSLDRKIVFDAYAENRTTGSFILIDLKTNATVGAGLIEFALRRSQYLHWQNLAIDKAQRFGKAAEACRSVVHWPVWLRQINDS